MSSIRFLTLRNRLQNYLDGQAPLESFQEWFVEELWSIEAEHDWDAQPLAYRIENRLAEYSSGSCSESELKRSLSGDLEEQIERPIIAARA